MPKRRFDPFLVSKSDGFLPTPLPPRACRYNGFLQQEILMYASNIRILVCRAQLAMYEQSLWRVLKCISNKATANHAQLAQFGMMICAFQPFLLYVQAAVHSFCCPNRKCWAPSALNHGRIRFPQRWKSSRIPLTLSTFQSIYSITLNYIARKENDNKLGVGSLYDKNSEPS